MTRQTLREAVVISALEMGGRYGFSAPVEIGTDVDGSVVALHLLDEACGRRVLTIRHPYDPRESVRAACASVYARTDSAIREWLTATGRGALLDAVETEERWKALLGGAWGR